MAKATREGFRPQPIDRSTMIDLPMEEFPNPVSVNIGPAEASSDIVEIVDDTPEEDRGRPTDVDDLAPVAGDSPNVAKRIARIKAETHTERRGREEAERQREAAIEAARVAREEVADLRRRLEGSTGALAASMKSDRESKLADAKARLERAHAEGDSAAVAAATADMGMVQAELVQIASRTPVQRAQPEPERQPVQQQRQAPNLAPAAAAWISKNSSWFNVDQAKTQFAVSLHNALDARGIKPTSPNYASELDKGMKAVYSDHVDSAPAPVEEDDGGPPTPRRTNVVADGSRETGRVVDPRKVVLTSSELAVAKRIGLTTDAQLAAYARSKQKQGAGA